MLVKPFQTGNPFMDTIANSEKPDEMPPLCGISSGSSLFAMTKIDLNRKKFYAFSKFFMWPPNMCNGPSWLNSTKLYGKVH